VFVALQAMAGGSLLALAVVCSLLNFAAGVLLIVGWAGFFLYTTLRKLCKQAIRGVFVHHEHCAAPLCHPPVLRSRSCCTCLLCFLRLQHTHTQNMTIR
jgi:hypothetical protein